MAARMLGARPAGGVGAAVAVALVLAAALAGVFVLGGVAALGSARADGGAGSGRAAAPAAPAVHDARHAVIDVEFPGLPATSSVHWASYSLGGGTGSSVRAVVVLAPEAAAELGALGEGALGAPQVPAELAPFIEDAAALANDTRLAAAWGLPTRNVEVWIDRARGVAYLSSTTR